MSKISDLPSGGSLQATDYLIAVRSGSNVKVQPDSINFSQVDLADSAVLQFGDSQDLTIVHNTFNSVINQAGTGNLLIQKAGSTKLTINASGIDVTGSVTADGLAVDTAAPFMSFRESGATKLFIGESSAVGGGAGYYDFYAVTGLGQRFFTNSLERIRIDSSGNLNVSRLAYTSASTNGFHANADGWTHTSVSGEPTAYFNRNTSDGEVVRILKDGAIVGSIGTLDGNSIYIGNGEVNLRMIGVTNDIRPVTSTGTNRDAAVDLGDANARFKDLYLSNNISLSNATTSAFLQVSTDILQFGTSSDDPLAFYANNAERMRIDGTTGNVGIGVSVPTMPLDVAGACSDGGNTGANVNQTLYDTTSYALGVGGGIGFAGKAGSGSNLFDVMFATINGIKENANNADYSSALTFKTRVSGSGLTERMRIDSSGNVGIGVVPSAAYKMQVNVATNTVSTGSPVDSSLFNIAGGTTTVGDGVSLQLSNSSGAKETAWRISAVTASGNNGDLVFNGYAGGADYPERMRIDSSGNLLVGKTATGTGQGFEALYNGEVFCTIVNGLNTYHVYANGAYRFYVKPDGGISNFSANNVNLSDEREKKNVEALPSQWDCLKHWDLKQFHYNADDDALPKKYGVIAQEIEAHCPEVIDVFKVDEDTERMGVKEQQMMWMAIKALQEAQTRIESLEARIAALES